MVAGEGGKKKMKIGEENVVQSKKYAMTEKEERQKAVIEEKKERRNLRVKCFRMTQL